MTTDEEVLVDEQEEPDGAYVDRDGDELDFDPAQFGGLEEDGGVIEKYDMSGCVVTNRRGNKTTPFVGQSIWLLPFSPSGATYAGVGISGANNDDDHAALAKQFDRMCAALSDVVLSHNLVKLPGFDERPPVLYPELYQNPDGWRELPDEAVYYIWNIVLKGETPDAAGKGRNASRGGRSTRTNSRSIAMRPGGRRPVRR